MRILVPTRWQLTNQKDMIGTVSVDLQTSKPYAAIVQRIFSVDLDV